MRSEGPELIQLELKYCERCGGLWLRLQGERRVYCAPCELELLDLPGPYRASGRPRLPGNHKIEVRSQVEKPAALCGKGGRA